ncbi:MAG: di-heme oxidoredictase family protein, partial [Granulosicoccus sp.]
MKYSLSVATLLLIATCGVAVNSSLQASNAEPVTTSSGNSTLPDAIWEGNARVRGVLRSTTDFSRPEKFELMQGGAGTQRTNFDRNAYSHEMTTLGFEGLKTFKLGNALFNKFWVASPSSTQASDGLGPFYNARACQSCHIKDGRGQVPQSDEKTASLVIQLKNSGNGQWGPDPTYGAQFQTSAVPGVEAEGLVSITYDTVTKTFNDGSKHGLRKPTYTLEKLAYGDLHPETILSPRLASAVHGLGLLESIDDAHVLAYADPDDSDGDGISGRPNWQLLENGQRKLGRFGHKAAMSSIREQNAHALFTDMGLSSSTDTLSNPHGDCTSAQRICNSLAHGEQSRLDKGEAPDQVVDLITFYTQNLAVPARRDVSDPDIL